jgi:hypothetical protein
MLVFGKKDSEGYHHSNDGKYVIWPKFGGGWAAAKWPIPEENGVPKWLHDGGDNEEARWVCEDDKYRYPCGCVLHVRPDWWKHCPSCGAALPAPVPYEPPPPKPERKVKEPNRPEWMKAMSGGIEGGQRWDCVYDGIRWALIRIPGAKSWVSVGASAYFPTSFEVVKKADRHGMHARIEMTAGKTSLLKVKRPHAPLKDFSKFTVHEGRAKLVDIARFKGMVDELDAKGV